MAGEDGVTVQEVVGVARVVELVGVQNIFVQGDMLWSALLRGRWWRKWWWRKR